MNHNFTGMGFQKVHKPQQTTNQDRDRRSFISPPEQLINKDSNQGVQAKLKEGKANDKHEKEADNVADKVVDSSKHTAIGPACPISAKPSSPESIQRAIERIGRGTNYALKSKTSKLDSQLLGSKGKGTKMDASTRDEMESGFGRDFGNVNIHTGTDAVQMNKELGAKAFTNGSDVYFNKGEYNPSSEQGKHLLAHELTHTVQQAGRGQIIQRSIDPEQVSEEMIGKGFTLDQQVTVKYDSGTVIFPKWQFVKILEWENENTKVRVSAKHKEKGKTYKFYVRKNWITPYAHKEPGLYKYEAGLDDVKENIASGQESIDSWKAGKSEYEKFNTMNIYNAELQNREQLQANRYEDLNRKLIQESMYNDFDAIIKKWTDYYNNSIGKAKGWEDLDANLVKSMIFQESEMGTTGTHLLVHPREGSVKTRFNLTQSIDSSGAILTLMIKEMNPTLYDKYNLDQVNKDLQKDKKRMSDLEKIKKTRELNDAEKSDYSRIDRVAPLKKDGESRYWDSYIRNHANFKPAWKEFNDLGGGKERRNQYEFWIRAGVRWLFEKREGVSNWSDAVKAYNGSGDRAEYYRNNVVTRRDKAKIASEDGNEFKPKKTY